MSILADVNVDRERAMQSQVHIWSLQGTKDGQLTFRQNLRPLNGSLNLRSISCIAVTEMTKQLLASLLSSRLLVPPMSCSKPTSPITSRDCRSSRLSMSSAASQPASWMRASTWLEVASTCRNPFLQGKSGVPNMQCHTVKTIHAH
jgi:hypothetical protein